MDQTEKSVALILISKLILEMIDRTVAGGMKENDVREVCQAMDVWCRHFLGAGLMVLMDEHLAAETGLADKVAQILDQQ